MKTTIKTAPTKSYTKSYTVHVSCEAIQKIKDTSHSHHRIRKMIDIYTYIALYATHWQSDDWGRHEIGMREFGSDRNVISKNIDLLQDLGLITVNRHRGKKYTGRTFGWSYALAPMPVGKTVAKTVIAEYPTPPRHGRNDLLAATDWTPAGVYQHLVVSFRRASSANVSPHDWKTLCWYVQNSNREAELKASRYYHPYHALPSRLRQYLQINGSPLVEAADLPCSALLQLAKVQAQDTSPGYSDELQRLTGMVLGGDIYSIIAQLAGNPVVTEDIRSRYKKAVQKWINIAANQRAYALFSRVTCFTDVDRFFKSNYPLFHAKITTSPMIKNKKGKRVSTVVYDIFSQELETMCGFCAYLAKTFKACPITCHDAVYLGVAEVERIEKAAGQTVSEILTDYYISI